jgi:hypothetical protein
MANASFADMHMGAFEVDRTKYAMNPVATGKMLDFQLDTKQAYRVKVHYWVKTAATDATGVKINIGHIAAATTSTYAGDKTIGDGLACVAASIGGFGCTIATNEIILAAGERLVAWLVNSANNAAVSAVGIVGRFWIEAIVLS